MKKNEPISKIVTHEVETTHTAEKVSDVRKKLAKNHFHHMPVVSGKKLIGMLSSSDILGISVEGVGSDMRSMDAYLDHQFSIEELMRTELTTLPPNATIADAADALSDGSIHAVPVVDADGHLEGIVTSTDLIRFLRSQF